MHTDSRFSKESEDSTHETAIRSVRVGLADRLGTAGKAARRGVPAPADSHARRHGHGIFLLRIRPLSAGIRAVGHGHQYGGFRPDGAVPCKKRHADRAPHRGHVPADLLHRRHPLQPAALSPCRAVLCRAAPESPCGGGRPVPCARGLLLLYQRSAARHVRRAQQYAADGRITGCGGACARGLRTGTLRIYLPAPRTDPRVPDAARSRCRCGRSRRDALRCRRYTDAPAVSCAGPQGTRCSPCAPRRCGENTAACAVPDAAARCCGLACDESHYADRLSLRDAAAPADRRSGKFPVRRICRHGGHGVQPDPLRHQYVREGRVPCVRRKLCTALHDRYCAPRCGCDTAHGVLCGTGGARHLRNGCSPAAASVSGASRGNGCCGACACRAGACGHLHGAELSAVLYASGIRPCP